MEETSQLPKTPHIAIIPTPGMGHLIPLTELARKLAELNFSITFLIPNDGSPSNTKSQLSLLQTLPSSISHRFLPPVDFSDLPPNTGILTRISLTLTRSINSLRDSLRVIAESTRLVAFVVDIFGSLAFDLAQEFGILPYMFFCSSALSLCLISALPRLDKIHPCEYRDLPEPVQLFPGCVPVHGADFPDPVQDKQGEAYKELLNIIGHYHKAAGILVNSFLDLEPAAFKHLMEAGRENNNIPPVYPVGPIIRTGSQSEPDGSGCLRWLDEQPSETVLFVSFGSGGTLSHEQLVELAFGLEMSRQRFLWVVKSPHDKAVNASYFTAQSIDDPLIYLPDGFLERTHGLGFLVTSWAPQIRILSHGSTGGFLTHCGWNSILESIHHGVPLIAWPLYAEQKLNSVSLAEDLRVGLRVIPNEKGIIGREQIANYARSLIQGEGKVLRYKMRTLKRAAHMALDENGLSKQSLDKVAQVWMNHNSIDTGLVPNSGP